MLSSNVPELGAFKSGEKNSSIDVFNCFSRRSSTRERDRISIHFSECFSCCSCVETSYPPRWIRLRLQIDYHHTEGQSGIRISSMFTEYCQRATPELSEDLVILPEYDVAPLTTSKCL